MPSVATTAAVPPSSSLSVPNGGGAVQAAAAAPLATTSAPPPGACIAGEAEAAKIKMMMAAAGAEWQAPRPRFPDASGKGRGGGGRGGGGRGDGLGSDGRPIRKPPAGYVCFRCNQPGHYIQFCPSNGEPNEPQQQQRRRPVGIPTVFLKTVEADVGGFQMADGTVARMVPDGSTFNKETRNAVKGVRLDPKLVPEELRCPMTKGLFREPVVLPCCGASVSNDAVAQACARLC